MKKGGQLTIFVIVAIVVVIAIAGFYVVKDNLFNIPIEGSDIVRISLIECLEFTTDSALTIVAYQGGYNEAPEKNFNFSPAFFPYYYYEGANLMPSLNTVEDEMGKHVSKNLRKCLSDIDINNFELGFGIPDVDVEITREGVEFVVNMPISLSREDKTMTIQLNSYPMFHETKLLDIYEISSFFVEDQVQDPELYCISCINRMATEAQINFYLFPILDDVIIVMAFEDKEDPIVFNFVNKYVSSVEAS